MRLTVLGGSAASPNPGAGCAGFLVETPTTRIVLDLGPGTLQELRRHTDFRTLSAVVISHMHVDHVLDLVALRHALAYNPIPAPAPVPVWLPPGGAAHLAEAVAPFDRCDRPGRFDATVRVREYDPGQPLALGDATLTFAPTVHDIPCWAVRMHAPGGADLGYTADTGPSANLAPFFAGTGLLVAEATLLDPQPERPQPRGSLTAREAGELAQAASVETLLLTHIWSEHGADRARAEAATAFAGRIEVAQPGQVVRWSSADRM